MGSESICVVRLCGRVCSLLNCINWVSDWFVFLSLDLYFEQVQVDIVSWYKNLVNVVSIRCSFGVGIVRTIIRGSAIHARLLMEQSARFKPYSFQLFCY